MAVTSHTCMYTHFRAPHGDEPTRGAGGGRTQICHGGGVVCAHQCQAEETQQGHKRAGRQAWALQRGSWVIPPPIFRVGLRASPLSVTPRVSSKREPVVTGLPALWGTTCPSLGLSPLSSECPNSGAAPVPSPSRGVPKWEQRLLPISPLFSAHRFLLLGQNDSTTQESSISQVFQLSTNPGQILNHLLRPPKSFQPPLSVMPVSCRFWLLSVCQSRAPATAPSPMLAPRKNTLHVSKTLS